MIRLVRKEGKFFPLALFFLIALPFFAVLISLSLGRMNISIGQILEVFFNLIGGKEVDAKFYSVIINIRLPRIILALLVGAGMSTSGLSYQSLFSNPLATPDILGVTSATCLGAVIAILFSLNLFWTQVIALVFGLLAVFLTLYLGKTRDSSIINLILSGIIMSSIFNALISILKYVADPMDKLPEITYWLMGSFSGASYKSILFGGPIIIVGILMIYLLRWRLNVLSLSEEEAKSMGLDVKKVKLYFIIASTLVTASSVSMCGQIGWIGLIVPHIARMMVGSNNLYLLPVSISLGASFMVFIETLSRSLTVVELPLSALTALIGAPIFILLLRRRKGGYI